MSEYTAGQVRREPSGWAIGFTAFAGAMLLMIGFFHATAGLVALFNNHIYAVTPNYIFTLNTTTWGWLHLILGIVVLIAGFGVFSGAVWARTIGVIVAVISAIANFAFLPYYPLWATLIIAVDVAVIWALTAHGRDIAMEE
jgi:hypothetical protein